MGSGLGSMFMWVGSWLFSADDDVVSGRAADCGLESVQVGALSHEEAPHGIPLVLSLME